MKKDCREDGSDGLKIFKQRRSKRIGFIEKEKDNLTRNVDENKIKNRRKMIANRSEVFVCRRTSNCLEKVAKVMVPMVSLGRSGTFQNELAIR